MISTSTMNATPAMCQYAEIVFRSAVTLTWNMLMIPAAIRKIAYSTKIDMFAEEPNQSFMCAE